MLKIIHGDAWSTAWVWMKGPDAQDFLHRLSTTKIKQLQPGQGARSCFLTGTGRIRSYHTIWCVAPGEYGVELDPGKGGIWNQELLKLIEELTFAEKFTLNEWSDSEARFVLAEAGSGKDIPALFGGIAPLETKELAPGLRVSHMGDVDFGQDLIALRGSSDVLNAWIRANLPHVTEVSAQQLEALRIRQVRPRSDAEITLDSNPLELGLVECFPRAKGCYPGQEVIERTISIGSPARRLALIEIRDAGGAEAWLPGAKVLVEGAIAGTVTSAVSDSEGTFILSLLRKGSAREGLHVSIESASAKAEGLVRGLCRLPAND